MAETAQRWDAYFAGEIIDRPLVCINAPYDAALSTPGSNYHDRVFGDIDVLLDRALAAAHNTYFGGESLPYYWLSFGPDEIAVFCGAELAWSDDSGDTNWSKPCITDWAAAPTIAIDHGNALYQRMLTCYRRAAERLGGQLLLAMPDLHTNMDLVAALRGPQQLCEDLLDEPEAIDHAMCQARAVFPVLWNAVWEAGCFDEFGYLGAGTTLQCDFSCMISPPMFRRWVLPALEEEAALVGRAQYHWDGPGALVHTADLLASKGLHTMGYVPGDGAGRMIDHLDLLKRVQDGGKAVSVWGTPDELQAMHRELRPEKVLYATNVNSPAEAEALLQWFVRNT